MVEPLNQKGFTLTEAMVSIGLSAVAVLLIVALLDFQKRGEHSNKLSSNRNALFARLGRLVGDPATLLRTLENPGGGTGNTCFKACLLGKSTGGSCGAGNLCRNTETYFQLFHPQYSSPYQAIGAEDTTPVFYTKEGTVCAGDETNELCLIKATAKFTPICPGDTTICLQASSVQVNLKLEPARVGTNAQLSNAAFQGTSEFYFKSQEATVTTTCEELLGKDACPGTMAGPSCKNGPNSWCSVDTSGVLGTSYPKANVYHTAVWTGSSMIVWGGREDPALVSTTSNLGFIYNPTADSWAPISTTSAPTGRAFHTAVWTGTTMIIWGGVQNNAGEQLTPTTGIYTPASDTWSTANDSNAPPGRKWHTAVWTGSKMVIWGGADLNGIRVTSAGGRLDPTVTTNAAWQSIEDSEDPEGDPQYSPKLRYLHSAVWTGTRMIIWGGIYSTATYNNIENRQYLDTGAEYDPTGDRWYFVPPSNAPTARAKHSAVWTGTKMIVWGGEAVDRNGAIKYLNTGGLYTPSTNWTSMQTQLGRPFGSIAMPPGRANHAVTWTGSKMVVWGGTGNSGTLDTGAAYDPVRNNWAAITTTGRPSGRRDATVVWDGYEMIIWGGYSDSGSIRRDDGGRYVPGGVVGTPQSDIWRVISSASAPVPRQDHVAVWTGAKMIVWGGRDGSGNLASGGLYDPVANTWVATCSDTEMVGVYKAKAVWDGNRMFVYGGYNGSNVWVDDGFVYDPTLDTGAADSCAVSLPSIGEERRGMTLTLGREVIYVIGGIDGSDNSQSNVEALSTTNPASWSTPFASSNDLKRRNHTTVYTGDKLLVWGGIGEGSPGAPLASGSGGGTGKSIDIQGGGWSDIESDVANNAPSARYGQAAVWTGSEMLIYGGSDSTTTNGKLNNGKRYQPGSGTWLDLTSSTISARGFSPATTTSSDAGVFLWTGIQMLIFGGRDSTDTLLANGALYTPGGFGGTWAAISNPTNITPGPLTIDARMGATGVWADGVFIYWGGWDSSGYKDSGAIYQP